MSRSETVWIVDDDRSIRWVLEKALQQEGMTTVSFDSADSVIGRLGRQQPDVIISDIRMPGASGLDLLAQIRELHPRLPVIIMTAHSDLDSAVASYQGGAFEYLPKPFDVDEAVSWSSAPTSTPRSSKAWSCRRTRRARRRSSARRRRCRRYSAPSAASATPTSPC